MSLVTITESLINELALHINELPFPYVYNPLEYAKKPYYKYLRQYGGGRKKAIFIGMNPGPWGMAQTGIPFGEVTLVKEWLRIEGAVNKPVPEHPKRPIDGFGCSRSEVSGKRFWGWAKDVYGTPQNFFSKYFVSNYCPLIFFDESGKNITPDKLKLPESRLVFSICDKALLNTVLEVNPQYVIGVGNFAMKRALVALDGLNVYISKILHPSPANPKANRGWQKWITEELAQLGLME